MEIIIETTAGLAVLTTSTTAESSLTFTVLTSPLTEPMGRPDLARKEVPNTAPAMPKGKLKSTTREINLRLEFSAESGVPEISGATIFSLLSIKNVC